MDRRHFLSGTTGLTLAATTLASNVEQREAASDLTRALNPKIQRGRQAALAILKPSKKTLERGLRLHAESVIFDGYGFSPNSAIDGDAMATAVTSGASAVELKDLREEMSMTRLARVVCDLHLSERRRRGPGPSTTPEAIGTLHLCDRHVG